MKNKNELSLQLDSIRQIFTSNAVHIYVKGGLQRCMKMANCGSSMHLCSLWLGHRDRMMLLRHNQQQTGSLDRSLHSLHSIFTHSKPELTHHSFHRNKKFYCEKNVPSTCTTTCTINSVQRNSCKMAKKRFSQNEHAN